MHTKVGIVCLALLLSYCCILAGNLLQSSFIGMFHSAKSKRDVINVQESGKRDSVQEVALSRSKRNSDSDSDNERVIRFLLEEESEEVSPTLINLVLSNEEDIQQTIARKTFVEDSNERMTFFIDRRVSRHIEILETGACESLILPPGESIITVPLQRIHSIYQVIVPKPETIGEWTIFANSSFPNTCTVTVNVFSTLGFAMSLMTKEIEESDTAYRAINELPNRHKSLAVILDGYGLEALKSGPKDRVETVRFVNDTGHDVIDPVHVNDDANGLNSKVEIYINNGLGTYQPVYVEVIGRDYSGFHFSRIIPQPIKLSYVSVTCELRDIIIQTEQNSTFDVIIQNHGEKDTFVVSVSDAGRYINPIRSSHQINASESRTLSVSARASASIAEGTTNLVSITVEGTRPGSLQRETCRLVVGKPSNPRIDVLTIEGTINSRFAETVVTSSMTNYANVGLEAKFDVLLPIDAFITRLTMTLDNVTIEGIVEEKERAQKIFEKAKERGTATGQVAARESSTRVFKTSLFVGAGKNVTFRVIYQQLLGKIRGSYKYTVVVDPNQQVEKLNVNVYIEEEDEIDYIRIPSFENFRSTASRQPAGTSVTFLDRRRSAQVKYNPLPVQQTPLGLSNSFSVLYDVVRKKLYGGLSVANGYFALFFTPLHLPIPRKKVMFIIDKSGSMGVTKMNQVKEAMATILKNLNEDDYFSVIFFDSNPSPSPLVRATTENVENAMRRVASIRSGGGTGIIPAFRVGFSEFTRHFQRLNNSDQQGNEIQAQNDFQNMIVFLTDGIGNSPAPTTFAFIRDNNVHDITIHTIAFGQDADRSLLQSIAAAHDGTYRMIFDGLTATAQIEDFFEEILSFSLRNVSITYPLNRIADVTRNDFKSSGSALEVVWAGRIKTNQEILDEGLVEDSDQSSREKGPIAARISGSYLGEELEIDVPIDPKKSASRIITSEHQIEDFTERLWAFLQIKQLLREAVIAKDDPNATALINEKALNMSLKYNFVTPLTSIVVVLPDELKSIEEEIKSEELLLSTSTTTPSPTPQSGGSSGGFAGTGGTQGSTVRRIVSGTGGGGTGQSGGGLGFGGVFGDPHFVIPLRSDVKLCFNWDSEDGKFYNLLHDPSDGITVNAKMIRIEDLKSNTGAHKVYISALGFILPKLNLEIVIRPNVVSLVSKGLKDIVLPVSNPMMITRHGVQLRIYDVKTKRTKILLSAGDWSFTVGLERNIHEYNRTNHLDLFIERYNDHWVSPLSGILGQFLHRDVRIALDDKSNHTIMTINNRSSRVITVERHMPWSHEKFHCWSPHSNPRDLIQGVHDDYLVRNLLKQPSYNWM